MKRTITTLALGLTLLVASSTARAADWVMLGGTEEGRKDGIAPWGFAQLLVESTPWTQPVTGLQAPPLLPFEGQHLAAEIGEPFDLSVRRARLGVRGSVPGTDRRLSFTAAVEAGENGVTRERGLVLIDATATWSVVPGLRLRVGQFKTPTADEALENNPAVASFTRFSPYVAALLIEQDVENGAITGPALAFRDVGVQVFDALPLWSAAGGRLDLTYAAVASLGRPAHAFDAASFVDDVTAQLTHVAGAGPDVTGRVQLSWIFDEATRHRADRDEASLWLWQQRGSRPVTTVVDGVSDVSTAARTRQGIGARLRLAGVTVRGEAAFADGVVLAQGAFAGQPATILADGVAWGGSLDVSVAKLGALDLDPFVLDVTYDILVRNPDDAAASRTLHGVTVGTQVKLGKNFRLLVNGELRRQDVGEKAPPDAAVIAAGLSPLVSAQLNLVF
jgi:hypothetical protein